MVRHDVTVVSNFAWFDEFSLELGAEYRTVWAVMSRRRVVKFEFCKRPDAEWTLKLECCDEVTCDSELNLAHRLVVLATWQAEGLYFRVRT